MLLGQTRTARERMQREEKTVEFGIGHSARFHRSNRVGGYLHDNQHRSVPRIDRGGNVMEPEIGQLTWSGNPEREHRRPVSLLRDNQISQYVL
eukprot:SAG31_NODE_259_length_18917_cov_28.559677_20_plen_93_part_00